MSKFTVKTTFDSGDSLIFSAVDKQGNFGGVLKVNKEIITFIDPEGKETRLLEGLEVEELAAERELTFNSPSTIERKWVQYQPNPKNNRTGDCTIRAYTKAEGISWEEAYDMAANYGMEESTMPNDDKVIKRVLEDQYGYTYTKLSKEERVTVNEFATANQHGTYLCLMRGHIVCIVDGLYYDSWDCGDKKITGYWTK
jgi:hypothetical protein